MVYAPSSSRRQRYLLVQRLLVVGDLQRLLFISSALFAHVFSRTESLETVMSALAHRGIQSLQVIFKEISLRMSRVDAPPIYQYHSSEDRGTYQLLMKTLNTLKRVTRKLALHLALNPTATMIQAPNPTMETTTRAKDHFPWKMNPIKRKINKIRPASWKLFVSLSSRGGRGDLLLPPIGLT